MLRPYKGKDEGTGEGKKISLADLPGVAGAEEFVEVAGAALGDYVLDLLIQNFFVAWLIVPVAQDADGGGKALALFHLGQGESVGGNGIFRVVDEQIALRDAAAELHDFQIHADHADALVAIFAEDHGFTLLEGDDVLAAGVTFGEREPGAVVEDVAVLQDF